MATTDPVRSESSEADLDEAFEASPEFGIRYLDSEFRERVLRHIKRCGWGFFDYHDLLDVYQETVIGMLEKARKPEFEPCRSLRMVLTIARNKAIDLLRKRGHKINLDEDAILEVVAADTKGSDILFKWRMHTSPIVSSTISRNSARGTPTGPSRTRSAPLQVSRKVWPP